MVFNLKCAQYRTYMILEYLNFAQGFSGVYKHISRHQKTAIYLDQKLGRESSYNAVNVRIFIKMSILNVV